MKKYTFLLLTLVMSASLLGCTQQSSPTATSSNQPAANTDTNTATTAPTATTTGESVAAGKQGDKVSEQQVQAAIAVAKKYKETEYTVPDYKNLDIEFQIPTETDDPPKLPPSIQQHYDQLLQYATESALTYTLENRLLDVPLRLAIHGKSPVSPQQLELHADPVLKVKGIMEIDYKMNIQLDRTKEQLPLEGTMQLQQIDGQWKVIHDAYDSTDLSNLINRFMTTSK
ncbi:hypothetical protein [Paenibacillus wulumuqiensis]|uniref:hypothetical protein n=1 Tax=Paenibacillus wulumuqiensis TaxID=1567107 RepID=UPI000619CBFE|nr:hypothetical protein [Paenibacillus wulumuqiensis]